MKLSAYQTAVIDFVKNGSGNAVVEAVAGSGKTKTVEIACKELLDDDFFNPRILYLVFNKKNQVEAEGKLPDTVEARTFNSFGNGLCYQMGRRGRIDAKKSENIYKFDVAKIDKISSDSKRKEIYQKARPISRLIGLFRGYACMSWAECFGMFEDICAKHEIDLPESFDIKELHDTWVACEQSKKRDYDDQLYLPIRHGVAFPKYDYVFVDECQDLNRIKIQIVQELVKAGARAICVGDSHQAIYGFAGADSHAMAELKTVLDGKSLPLSICYRCARSIVAAAKEFVPHIEAAPDAKEGVIREVSMDKYPEELNKRDFILSRVTAPLVSECLRLIREGRQAVVLGREIGTGLIELAKKLGSSKLTIEDAHEKLSGYELRQAKKLQHNETALEAFNDRVMTLRVLFERCNYLGDIERVVDQIFSDTAQGITFMTCHKSKGLEADRVYVMRDRLPLNVKQEWSREQERNLEYVAITRAKEELVWITKTS